MLYSTVHVVPRGAESAERKTETHHTRVHTVGRGQNTLSSRGGRGRGARCIIRMRQLLGIVLFVCMLCAASLLRMSPSTMAHPAATALTPPTHLPPPLLPPPPLPAALPEAALRLTSYRRASVRPPSGSSFRKHHAAYLAHLRNRSLNKMSVRPAARVQTSRAEMMDLEAGVRLGSLCSDADDRRGPNACPTASSVLEKLDHAASAAAISAAEPSSRRDLSPLCLFTSLTDAYVEGHEVFMRSAQLHAPSILQRQLPLYVLDQSLSPRARARVLSAYKHTRLMSRGASGQGTASLAKDVRTVTKFALNKEKTLLFNLVVTASEDRTWPCACNRGPVSLASYAYACGCSSH